MFTERIQFLLAISENTCAHIKRVAGEIRQARLAHVDRQESYFIFAGIDADAVKFLCMFLYYFSEIGGCTSGAGRRSCTRFYGAVMTAIRTRSDAVYFYVFYLLITHAAVPLW